MIPELEWVKALGPILISWPVAALIAVLVFRKDIQRLKIGSFELEMVKKAVDEVGRRQTLQESEIKAIQAALKGILTKYELGLLEGLNGPTGCGVRYEPDLKTYLHRLDGLNFIQPNKGYGLITIEERHRDDEKLPGPPHERPLFDLKEFVYITDDGKRYLSILSDILKKAEEGTRGEDKGDRHS